MGQKKITSRQFMIFVALYNLENAVLDESASVIDFASGDAWIWIIMLTVLGICLGWLYTTLMCRCPGMNLLKCVEHSLSKVIGRGLGSIARWAKSIFFWLVGLFLMLLFLVLLNVDVDVLKPILADAPLPVIQGWLEMIGPWFEPAILLVIPLSLITYAVALTAVLAMLSVELNIGPLLTRCFGLILPLILPITSLIRGKSPPQWETS